MRPIPDQILDHREFPVLYVDDEKENLRIFELSFRRDFSILSAETAVQALDIINECPVAVVLSDQRMPGMTGTEFLARVSEIDPKTVRVLVTAYGDAGTLENAINNGSIYKFVRKPWSPEEMRLTIRRGIEVYALDRERDQLVRELTLLNRISKRISQELEYQALLELLVGTVTEELGFDSAGILIHHRKEEALYWEKFSGSSSVVSDLLSEKSISRKLAPRFFEGLDGGRAQILRAEDLLDFEAPIRFWSTEVAADETLVIPLAGSKGLIGAFCVDNRRGGKRFTAEDRTLIEGIAYQAAISIENAQLVEDLRRSQEQVIRSERLGTLGTLAAGLAHEINNPLVSIRTFLSMAPRKRNEDDEEFWGEYHELATGEVERIRRLVETMRQLGRDDRSQVPREEVDLCGLVRQVARLIERGASEKRVAIEIVLDSDHVVIHAVRDQLHQVIMNLVLNGIHSAAVGGNVRIHVGSEQAESVGLIEVTDDGDGIPDDVLERIFDPFFTTKDPNQGSGLGLMICHRIVADHGGSIEVDSRPGFGATFGVRIPTKGVVRA